MKANLPAGGAAPHRAVAGGRPLRRSCAPRARGAALRPPRRPPLRQRRTSTSGTSLNKVLKDIVVRSRTHGRATTRRTCPGWDCHGLPIELQVDSDSARRRREMSPVAFRRALPRRTPRSSSRIQREEFKRLGVMGEWDEPVPDDGPRLPGHDRARARPTFVGEGPRLQGQEVRALVHLVTARRWPRPRSSTTRTTRARRSTCASRSPTTSAAQLERASRARRAAASPR